MINIVSSVCSILFRYLFTKTHPVQFLPNNLVLMYLVRKCWNYVGKEYRIFNLGFAIFTSYLLIDELKLYFIYKPTFTSIVQTKLIIRSEDAVVVPTVAVQRSQNGSFRGPDGSVRGLCVPQATGCTHVVLGRIAP